MEMQPLPPPPPPPPPPATWNSFSFTSSTANQQNGNRTKPQTEYKPTSNPFKDELTNRLLIRESNKCNLAVEQQRLLPLISSSSGQQMSSTNSRDSNWLSKDKQSGDRRPFAYSPDVNDPNRKGKLDLSQIKSPVMRRRLMANMRSTDEEDEDKYESVDEQTDAVASPKNNIHSYNDTIQSSTNIPRQEEGPVNVEPVIQCNEPVTFFSQRNYSSPAIRNDVEKLDLELAESLDSLTKLVSNLQGDCDKILCGNPKPSARPKHSPQIQYYPPQQVITICPPSQSKISKGSYGGTNQVSSSRPNLDARTIGDYILSPDSSYFMMTSNDMPHSITPYYGVNFELEQTATAASPYCSRGSSSRTFSPQPLVQNYSHTCNTSCAYGYEHQ